MLREATAGAVARYSFKLEFSDGRWDLDEQELPAAPRVGDLVEFSDGRRWQIRGSQFVRPRTAGKPLASSSSALPRSRDSRDALRYGDRIVAHTRRRVPPLGGLAVVVYLAGATAWTYGVAARSDDARGIPGEFLMALPMLVVGFAVGRRWALLVPLVLPLLALGAGRGTNLDADSSIATGIALTTVPLGLLLTAVGLGARALLR